MSAITPRLEMRQGQSLVMTQQLQQSIKLLQMSSQELQEFIELELEKNPLLSSDDTGGENPSEQEEKPVSEDNDVAEKKEQDDGKDDIAPSVDADSTSTEPQWESSESYEETQPSAYEGYDLHVRAQGNHTDDEGGNFEAYTAEKPTLREHLLSQLRLEASDIVQRVIGQHLIDLVDESGYIKEDVSAIPTLLGCGMDAVERTFALLHSFDPPGVCARSLQESLAIQLRDRNRLDPAMQLLLENLPLLAKNELTALTKLCGVDAEDIRDMATEIRSLNPKPGSGFEYETVQAVIPDVYVRRGKKDSWHIELNTHALPRVLVNRQYHVHISGQTREKQDRKYISDQLASANWLVKALESRAETILKVTAEIVTQQDTFFRHGIRYLRPLTLKEVAAAVELHESTVSRVTTAKYMASPRGNYELKYFFNASLGNIDGGEAYSNRTVQHLIKELIEKESSANILSDDAIAGLLKERGIDVARRTVAKYREILKIPSSSARKKLKSEKFDY